jgi:acyl carrier protein phosphodiesterase
LNYIAHIHIAAHTQTSLVGNFLGDFVKGSQFKHLPYSIEQGIRLHRSVDIFTDSHPLIIDLKQSFTPDLRRMAGVVIDIYFDYILIKNWHTYTHFHSQILFDRFYTELAQFSIPISNQFNQQASRLVTYRWLSDYAQIKACYRACSSIEGRLKYKILFADKAEHFFIENSEQFESTFKHFYPELLDHGVHFVKSY